MKSLMILFLAIGPSIAGCKVENTEQSLRYVIILYEFAPDIAET